MSGNAGAALAGLAWKVAAQAISDVFGTTFAQYRPSYATELSGFGTIVNAALPGYMTANAYQKTPMPLDPAKPRCHAVFDPAVLKPGDFLIGSLAETGVTEVFFVCTVQPPAPPSAVRCNAVVNVSRAVRASGFGAQAPLDTQIGTEETILVGWPASMLPTGRSATGPVQLPDDVNLGAYTVWLAEVPDGWTMDIDITVNTPALWDYVMANEAAYYAGAQVGTITGSCIASFPDGSQRLFRFTGGAMKLSDAGGFKGQDKVTQKASLEFANGYSAT